jgi:hypothetical protein
MQMIALEPPGNVAREIALFRRALFARLGEASALAFPELIPLAFAGHPDGPASRSRTRRLLEECWFGIEGAFGGDGALISGGSLYLSMGGPMGALRAAAAAMPARGAPLDIKAPLEVGLGFFLCRPADTELALAEATRIGLPRVGFLDCSLVILGLRLGPDPYAAAAWRELARARRRTGIRPGMTRR